jgi:hypothetical protein
MPALGALAVGGGQTQSASTQLVCLFTTNGSSLDGTVS